MFAGFLVTPLTSPCWQEYVTSWQSCEDKHQNEFSTTLFTSFDVVMFFFYSKNCKIIRINFVKILSILFSLYLTKAYSKPCQTSKAVNCFCKNLHCRCLARFCLRLHLIWFLWSSGIICECIRDPTQILVLDLINSVPPEIIRWSTVFW